MPLAKRMYSVTRAPHCSNDLANAMTWTVPEPHTAVGRDRYSSAMHLADLSEIQVKQLRLLGIVRDVQDSGRGFASAAVVAERAAGELAWPVDSVPGRIRLLADEGYVALDERLAGMLAGAKILPSGLAALEDFEAMRSSLPDRRKRARDEYLAFLYSEIEEHDRHPTPDAFLATSPSYYGLPYTAEDVEKVGEWLKKSGFIDGEAAWQYHGPLRPTLTEKGVFTVENERSVGDPPPLHMGTSYQTNVYGSANVNNGGNNVRQRLSIEWVTKGVTLLDTLEQALPSINADIADLVSAEIDAARTELADAADIGRLRATFTAIAGFLGATSAGALGNLLSDQVATFLANLPG